MSFYRTYRPQIIDEIDNLAVRESLLRLLTKPKSELPHAYLFSGPRGAGKTTSARLIAKLFNCLSPTTHGPCGSCEHCDAIAKGKSLDVLELDAASNRGIDEIRQIRDAIGLSPVSAEYRIYIIDEVHMLTTEAFNALLKTLEEPPTHAVFVLATTDPQKVPITIQSRCVPIAFTRASEAELTVALKRIVEREKLTIDDGAIQMIVSHVDGSFRDAVKQLEVVSFTKGAITAESVRGTMSIGEQGIRDVFLQHLLQKNTAIALQDIASVIASGRDIKLFTVECLGDLEKRMVSSVSTPDASGWTLPALSSLIKLFSSAFVDMRTTAIAQLPLELAVIEYCEVAAIVAPTIVAPVAVHGQAHTTPAESIALKHGVVHNKPVEPVAPPPVSTGVLTVEKLADHWPDIIAELKKHNHSISGVMRSTRPKSVVGDIVTVEAFFTFHKDKLSESKTRDMLNGVFYSLFGEKVKVEIVLGKK